VAAIVTLAPTESEIREDAALMERIAELPERLERRSSLPGSRGRCAAGRPIAWPAS
jgi:hypothetical protein